MKHMRIVVSHYGRADELQLVEEECPEPKSGEVRLKVLAAGVSLPDVMAREGVHPETPKVPFTPGWDLIGQVDCAGPSVSGFERGQLFAAMPIHGLGGMTGASDAAASGMPARARVAAR